MADPSTPRRILDAACDLAQTRGFNAFSFRDLSRAVGIKTASIHYHFPTKADLGRALMREYTDALRQRLGEIQARARSPKGRIRGFVSIFRDTYRSGGKICLGGSMASDVMTLDDGLNDEIRTFYAALREWLEQVIVEGQASGAFRPAAPPAELASSLVSALQGALIEARTAGDTGPIDAAERVHLRALGA